MTALVYLRSSFGFVFFRPKSVFFAFSWALLLFDIFAWNEPDRWREYRAVCIFGTGTVILYWLHLFTAISRELYRSGEDDHYSGASHGLRLAKFPGIGDAVSEKNLHLWGEPAAVLVLAALLSIVFGERHLSKWLVFVAACMVCKEGMNYWFSVRRDKIEEDMMGDVKGKGEGLPGDHPAPEAPKELGAGSRVVHAALRLLVAQALARRSVIGA